MHKPSHPVRQTADRHHADQARVVWPPEEGWFRLRLVPGAWAVPCAICQTEDGDWLAIVDGAAQPPHPDPAHAAYVADIWHGGIKIDRPTYERLLDDRDHAAAHGPADHPALHPRRAIDHNRLRPIPYRPSQQRTPS